MFPTPVYANVGSVVERDHRSVRVGRLILLASAYAPAALIVGFRAWPHTAGHVALVLGALGVGVWALFVAWIRQAQPRRRPVKDVEALDGDVTAYIASYLLPVVAANAPSDGDLIAYGICAVLLLVVGYAANLGAVNPIVYLFGLRTAQATVDGKRTVLLVKQLPADGELWISRGAGVKFIHPTTT